MVFPSTCTGELSSKNDNPVFYWCTTNDEWLVRSLMQCGYSDSEFVLGNTEQMETIIEQFEQAIYNFTENCDQRMNLLGRMMCLFSFISSVAVKKQTVSDKIFKRCLNRIESTSGNVTVDFLAKHYFVSRRHLYTMFKEYKNMSPNEYIMTVRMRAAEKYLVSTNYSVAEIAELIGYSNYSHFTRAYTKHFGISPSDKRKQANTQMLRDANGVEDVLNRVSLDE